ncbi:hypothetical protein [Candidatus Spongiihabitans sp.]
MNSLAFDAHKAVKSLKKAGVADCHVVQLLEKEVNYPGSTKIG